MKYYFIRILWNLCNKYYINKCKVITPFVETLGNIHSEAYGNRYIIMSFGMDNMDKTIAYMWGSFV